MNSPILLPGLDGSNPLAFLAALGTLRVAARAYPSSDPLLSWTLRDGLYRPTLIISGNTPANDFVQSLYQNLETDPGRHPTAFLDGLHGSDLPTVHNLLLEAATSSPSTPVLAFCAVLVSDASTDPAASSQIQIARRDYLWGNIQSIIRQTTREHLRRTLLQSWDYADALENQSLHLDPSEDRRYANQWHKPTSDPTRATRGGMLGANRLAIEALPFFPAIGKGAKLQTLGFQGNRADNTWWTWPIWEPPLSADSVVSVLGLAELQSERPDARALGPRGVMAAFRSQRILVGKTLNLTPSVRV